MSMAVVKNQFLLVKTLLQYGANINDPVDGITPLMLAADKGLVEMGGVLLKYGADQDAKTADGLTAADFAMKANHSNFLKLLQYGRNIKPLDPKRDMYYAPWSPHRQ